MVKDLASMPDTDVLTIPMPTFGSEVLEMTASRSSYYGEGVGLRIYAASAQG